MKKKKSLKMPSIITCAISIVILLFVSHFKTTVTDIPFLNDIIYPVAEMLCSVAITAAIGTYFIEWKGFVEYVVQKLSEVLSKPSMVKNLDKEYQSELLSALIYENTGIESEKFNGFMINLYKEMECQCSKNGIFLKEQLNEVSCKVYKSGGKEVIDTATGDTFRVLSHTRTITYGKLKSDKITIEEILAVNVFDEKLFNGNQTVVVNQVLLDSNKLKDNTDYECYFIDNSDSTKIDTMYKKKFVCNFKKPIEVRDGLKIQIMYDTIEPMNDFSYCTRMKYFCERYRMHFTYDETEFNVYVQAFDFGERKNQIIKDNTILFDRDDWLLPGEGTNIYIERK